MENALIFIFVGIVFVGAFIIQDANIFTRTLEHLEDDLQLLDIHIFIAGWMMLAYGLYKFLRFKLNRTKAE